MVLTAVLLCQSLRLPIRAAHFYLALYWARELSDQEDDPQLARRFSGLAQRLSENEEKILQELNSVQGSAVEIDGYYHFQNPDSYRRDRRKDMELQKHGYLVVRVLAEDVVCRLEEVLETILAAVSFQRMR